MSGIGPSGVAVRPILDGDWPAVQRIYREGIATGAASSHQRLIALSPRDRQGG